MTRKVNLLTKDHGKDDNVLNKTKTIPAVFRPYISKYSDWVRFQCYVYSVTGMSSKEFKKHVESMTDEDAMLLMSKIRRKQIKRRMFIDWNDIQRGIAEFFDQYYERHGGESQ
jgi:hypothetical protein